MNSNGVGDGLLERRLEVEDGEDLAVVQLAQNATHAW